VRKCFGQMSFRLVALLLAPCLVTDSAPANFRITGVRSAFHIPPSGLFQEQALASRLGGAFHPAKCSPAVTFCRLVMPSVLTLGGILEPGLGHARAQNIPTPPAPQSGTAAAGVRPPQQNTIRAQDAVMDFLRSITKTEVDQAINMFEDPRDNERHPELKPLTQHLMALARQYGAPAVGAALAERYPEEKEEIRQMIPNLILRWLKLPAGPYLYYMLDREKDLELTMDLIEYVLSFDAELSSEQTARLLEKFGPLASSAADLDQRRALARLFNMLGPDAFPYLLISYRRAQSAEDRSVIIFYMAESDPDRAIGLLADFLKNETEPDVVWALASALVLQDNDFATEQLSTYLKNHAGTDLGNVALRALADTPTNASRAAILEVIPTLQDSQSFVLAIKILGIDPPPEPLCEALYRAFRREPDSENREGLLGLLQWRNAGLDRFLREELLAERDPMVREKLVDLAANHGGPGIMDVLALIVLDPAEPPPLRAGAVHAIEFIPIFSEKANGDAEDSSEVARRQLDSLYFTVANTDMDVKLLLLRARSEVARTDAISFLINILQQPGDIRIRTTAADLLGSRIWNMDSAMELSWRPSIILALEQAAEPGQDRELRRTAISALGRLGPGEAFQVLGRILTGAQDLEFQKLALKALAEYARSGFGDVQENATSVLRQALGQVENPELRRQIQKVLDNKPDDAAAVSPHGRMLLAAAAAPGLYGLWICLTLGLALGTYQDRKSKGPTGPVESGTPAGNASARALWVPFHASIRSNNFETAKQILFDAHETLINHITAPGIVGEFITLAEAYDVLISILMEQQPPRVEEARWLYENIHKLLELPAFPDQHSLNKVKARLVPMVLKIVSPQSSEEGIKIPSDPQYIGTRRQYQKRQKFGKKRALRMPNILAQQDQRAERRHLVVPAQGDARAAPAALEPKTGEEPNGDPSSYLHLVEQALISAAAKIGARGVIVGSTRYLRAIVKDLDLFLEPLNLVNPGYHFARFFEELNSLLHPYNLAAYPRRADEPYSSIVVQEAGRERKLFDLHVTHPFLDPSIEALILRYCRAAAGFPTEDVELPEKEPTKALVMLEYYIGESESAYERMLSDFRAITTAEDREDFIRRWASRRQELSQRLSMPDFHLLALIHERLSHPAAPAAQGPPAARNRAA